MYGRRKKKNGQTTANSEEWTTGQWLVQKQTINARSHNDVKNRREDFGLRKCNFTEERNRMNWRAREREKKFNFKMCSNKKNCLSNLQNSQKCNNIAVENALSPFSLWQSENQDFLLSTVTETGGDRTHFKRNIQLRPWTISI